MKVRVLLAEDQTVVRAGFRALLDGTEDLVVVGEAENGREAIALRARRNRMSSSWISACRSWTDSRNSDNRLPIVTSKTCGFSCLQPSRSTSTYSKP